MIIITNTSKIAHKKRGLDSQKALALYVGVMHQGIDMDNKIAGILSLLGAVALGVIWWVFLFSARPDCLDSIELAINSARYALSPSESGTWLFVYTLVSIVICITTSLILLYGQQKKFAMYLIASHALAALFVYTWSLILAIALPLIYIGKVNNA